MTAPVDVLAVLSAVIDEKAGTLPRKHWNEDQVRRVRAAVAELIERDKQAQVVFDCILRGVNDLHVSPNARQWVDGWLRSWAKSMLAAGFKPTNPEAIDIRGGLARIGGAK